MTYQHDNTGPRPPCGPTTSQATTRLRGWRASEGDRMQPAEGRVVGRMRHSEETCEYKQRYAQVPDVFNRVRMS
jgi:hypothetical protein